MADKASPADVQITPTFCGLRTRMREPRLAFCAGMCSVLGCCLLAALITVIVLGTTTAIFFYPWLCRNGVDALGPDLFAQMVSGASNILFRNLNFVDGLEHSEVSGRLPRQAQGSGAQACTENAGTHAPRTAGAAC
jgi:hypothetical protein